MIAVVQRVCAASVAVDRNVTARIGPGALVLFENDGPVTLTVQA